jgi:aminopeptidase N
MINVNRAPLDGALLFAFGSTNSNSTTTLQKVHDMMRMLVFLLLVLFSETVFAQQPPFTRADTLRGMLRPERTCYDVTFYDLDVRIDPLTKFLTGTNTIHFKAAEQSKSIQVDLFENMKIEKVTLNGTMHASFRREFNSVFIDLPESLRKGSQYTVAIHYSGAPQVAARPPWDGGFSWDQDEQGNPWVVVTCQGEGASLWWPNKDHQSDEPDSMRISVTVPPGLMNVSNGRLRSTAVLPDGWTKFEWFVSHPINNYNVTVNIGKYAHFSDVHLSGNDTLTLDYYVMPQNLEKARGVFEQVKPMMACFERHFGQYPFIRDGFKLVESPHTGMEHQTAVAYGNWYIGGYRGRAPAEVGLKFDFIIIHETAHEWWGNSVTSNDLADMWIHESFGAYAEAVFVECQWGKEEALKYINGKKPNVRNDRPIIGPRNVNRPGSGDMYDKGQLVLNTLRSVIDNDSLWFAILKGLAETFKRSTIDAEDVFRFVNEKAGKDYTYFFEQYLMHARSPQLVVETSKKGDAVTARLRWDADVKDFRMPVKVMTSPGTYEFVYPTTEWLTVELKGMRPEEFKVAEDLFYVTVRLRWVYLDPALR